MIQASLRNPSNSGFTLVELLTTVALVPIVILALSQIFTSQIRIEQQQISGQSRENFRARLSFLIESDIADGEQVGANITGCQTPAGKIFDVLVPHFNADSNSIQQACITYSIVNGVLTRTGPPILTNGALDFGQQSSALTVASDVDITNEVFSPTGTSVDFTLEIPGFAGTAPTSYNVSFGTKNFRVGT